jgi:hypothetical protein
MDKGILKGREGLDHDICDMHLVIERRNVTARVGAVDELGFRVGAGGHLDPGIASPMTLGQCPIDSREQNRCIRL